MELRRGQTQVGDWNRRGFGKEIRRLREERGATVRDLADALGCEGTGPAWKLESGMRQTVPGPLAMRGLARLLGVSTSYLLGVAGYEL